MIFENFRFKLLRLIKYIRLTVLRYSALRTHILEIIISDIFTAVNKGIQ